jgi:MoaA/NifB/PqqE/SkfB family radical SAM enzyme
MDNVEMKKQIENLKREKLKKEKPLVYEKIIKLNDKFINGECIAIIDIAYDYKCNMKCNHCCNSRFHKKERSLTVSDLKNLSEQADKLGLCQFNISGGEPLLFKDIEEIILALNPGKFHLSMSTNGHFLDYNKAKRLKSLGLDKVKISLDNIDENIHNQNRNSGNAYKKAMDAIYAAKGAGLDVIIQHVISRQTAQTENTVKIAQFAQENDFTLDILIARALGEWEGKHEVLINQEDADFLYELHKKYPVARRDVFPSYGIDRGCGAVNCTLHVTKYGDVLPCVYIHIAIGNIFEERLHDIINRGFSIKHFRNFTPICLSGEDRHFIDKYMTKFYDRPLPIHYTEAFDKDDFIK